MFVNFSNHPSDKWSNDQVEAARKYGDIADVAFPNVPPQINEDAIDEMADECYGLIMYHDPEAVMCQGEFTLAYAVIKRLKEKGIRVLTACSERISEEKDGRKISEFRFVKFREYR